MPEKCILRLLAIPKVLFLPFGAKKTPHSLSVGAEIFFTQKFTGKSFAGCSRHDASRSAPLAGENELRNARRAGHSYDAYVMPRKGKEKACVGEAQA